MKLVFDRLRSPKMPFFAKPIAKGVAGDVLNNFVRPNIERQLTFVDAELFERRWFWRARVQRGRVQMSVPLEAAAPRGGLDTRYPRPPDWLARIHPRPGCLRALQASVAVRA
jgi:glutathione S-transferase